MDHVSREVCVVRAFRLHYRAVLLWSSSRLRRHRLRRLLGDLENRLFSLFLLTTHVDLDAFFRLLELMDHERVL